MKERLEQSFGVSQSEEVAARNDGRVHANAVAYQLSLKFEGKQTVVSPYDRFSRNVGPRHDIARLAERNVCFVTRIGEDGGSVLSAEVVEKVRLYVELGVVSAGLGGCDPSDDGPASRPPLPRGLSRCGHHCVDQDEPSDWNPIAGHHCAEATHRLGHHDWLSTALDGNDDHRRILGQTRVGCRTGQVHWDSAMTSLFELGAYNAPVRSGQTARSRYQDEVGRDPSSALRLLVVVQLTRRRPESGTWNEIVDKDTS